MNRHQRRKATALERVAPRIERADPFVKYGATPEHDAMLKAAQQRAVVAVSDLNCLDAMVVFIVLAAKLAKVGYVVDHRRKLDPSTVGCMSGMDEQTFIENCRRMYAATQVKNPGELEMS